MAFYLTTCNEIKYCPNVYTLKGLPRWFRGKKIHLPMKEMRVWSLGWEDLLEEEVATHSRILTWKIPQTKEPGGLQSVGLQRVRHDLVAEHARTCMWKGKLTDIKKKKKSLSSCWFELDSTKPKVMKSFPLTGAREGFDREEAKQGDYLIGQSGTVSCLIWKSQVGCSHLVALKFHFRWLKCINSGLGFGLLAWGTKALEPIQSHGLLV